MFFLRSSCQLVYSSCCCCFLRCGLLSPALWTCWAEVFHLAYFGFWIQEIDLDSGRLGNGLSQAPSRLYDGWLANTAAGLASTWYNSSIIVYMTSYIFKRLRRSLCNATSRLDDRTRIGAMQHILRYYDWALGMMQHVLWAGDWSIHHIYLNQYIFGLSICCSTLRPRNL